MSPAKPAKLIAMPATVRKNASSITSASVTRRRDRLITFVLTRAPQRGSSVCEVWLAGVRVAELRLIAGRARRRDGKRPTVAAWHGVGWARAILVAGAGTQWDPGYTEVF